MTGRWPLWWKVLATIGTAVVGIAGIISAYYAVRAYHNPPPSPPTATTTQPNTNNQRTELTNKNPVKRNSDSPPHIQRPPRKEILSETKNSVPQQINAPNSAISVNQSGGVTVHTINVGQQKWLVTAEQETTLVKSLSKTEVDPISVSFSYGDSEQRHFAESLIKALSSAGCKIVVHAPDTLSIPYGPGVSVLIKGDKPPYPKGSVALQKAFKDAKIDTLWYGIPNLAKDLGNIAIIIRSRP